MAHIQGYITNNRKCTVPRPRPREIGEFNSPQEFLMAIHGAVQCHRSHFFHTGEIHGNVNQKTVFIGSPSIFSNKMGFLVEFTKIDERFQPVNLLSQTVLGRKPNFRLDYLDDLESFYYLIAWASIKYRSPRGRLGRRIDASDWKISAREKELMLLGDGFECSFEPAGQQQVFLRGEVFEHLLAATHRLLKEYNLKRWRGNTEHLEMHKVDEIYDTFLGYLKASVVKILVAPLESFDDSLQRSFLFSDVSDSFYS